jgi:hypothetical protein
VLGLDESIAVIWILEGDEAEASGLMRDGVFDNLQIRDWSNLFSKLLEVLLCESL